MVWIEIAKEMELYCATLRVGNHPLYGKAYFRL